MCRHICLNLLPYIRKIYLMRLHILFLESSLSIFQLNSLYFVLRSVVCDKNLFSESYIYWTVHHCNSWKQKTNLKSLAILFHFLCAQHVSDINISIIGSLRLFCWITTLVVLFLVRCVLEFRCGWVGVVSVLQAYQEWYLCCRLKPATRIPLQPNHTETPTHIEPRTIPPMW